jgi:hypothetical protein
MGYAYPAALDPASPDRSTVGDCSKPDFSPVQKRELR